MTLDDGNRVTDRGDGRTARHSVTHHAGRRFVVFSRTWREKTSALDGAGGQAGLPVALETEEDHDHRQHAEQCAHHQGAAIGECGQRHHAVQTQGHRLEAPKI